MGMLTELASCSNWPRFVPGLSCQWLIVWEEAQTPGMKTSTFSQPHWPRFSHLHSESPRELLQWAWPGPLIKSHKGNHTKASLPSSLCQKIPSWFLWVKLDLLFTLSLDYWTLHPSLSVVHLKFKSIASTVKQWRLQQSDRMAKLSDVTSVVLISSIQQVVVQVLNGISHLPTLRKPCHLFSRNISLKPFRCFLNFKVISGDCRG